MGDTRTDGERTMQKPGEKGETVAQLGRTYFEVAHLHQALPRGDRSDVWAPPGPPRCLAVSNATTECSLKASGGHQNGPWLAACHIGLVLREASRASERFKHCPVQPRRLWDLQVCVTSATTIIKDSPHQRSARSCMKFGEAWE